jgi:hypothetical protein
MAVCRRARDVSDHRSVKFCVKTLVALSLVVIVTGCTKLETPTEPADTSSIVANAVSDERFTLDPHRIVLKPGETKQINVRAIQAYPLGIAFDCVREECLVAEIKGSIAQGASEGTITVRALQPGTARIVATIWNFGRAPGIATVGEVIVTTAEKRRRSVRH